MNYETNNVYILVICPITIIMMSRKCFWALSILFVTILIWFYDSLVTNKILLHLQNLQKNWVLTGRKFCKKTLIVKKILSINTNFNASSLSSSSFEGYPLQVRQKQDWGRGFILVLPQTAALPESDAGSNVIKPASSFVIRIRQTLCSMWCPMYGARC